MRHFALFCAKYKTQFRRSKLYELITLQIFCNILILIFINSDFLSDVMDIYRPRSGEVILIDLNPFGESTDSLLFDWRELNEISLQVIANQDVSYSYHNSV